MKKAIVVSNQTTTLSGFLFRFRETIGTLEEPPGLQIFIAYGIVPQGRSDTP